VSAEVEELFGMSTASQDDVMSSAAMHGRGSAGGWLEHIMLHASKIVFGIEDPTLEYTQGRNADVEEVKLVADGNVLLTFARVYGFRNIQNLVNKIKRG
jgi:hypothetical protein